MLIFASYFSVIFSLELTSSNGIKSALNYTLRFVKWTFHFETREHFDLRIIYWQYFRYGKVKGKSPPKRLRERPNLSENFPWTLPQWCICWIKNEIICNLRGFVTFWVSIITKSLLPIRSGWGNYVPLSKLKWKSRVFSTRYKKWSIHVVV